MAQIDENAMTPDSFAAFWQLFPRRVAKKAAEKAWSRVATSPEAIEQIMAGLRAQLPAMLKQERKFVPYPATWLNQQRFEDEQEVAKIRQRVGACRHCGDTGVLMLPQFHDHTLRDAANNYQPFEFLRCSCPIGQLPGALAGVSEL